MTPAAPSALRAVIDPSSNDIAFLQATCDACGYTGQVYPGSRGWLAAAAANRHDALEHDDYSGYRNGVKA